MVSTDIYWHFDRPEKLPERERPRSFVPRWESGTIKQYQTISNEPSALDTSCSKTVLSDQVGVMCQQGWSQRVESSLHVVLQSVHVFSCLDLFWKKSNVKLSLFNLFMMLAIWPLLLGVVRSEAGRTLPGIKWAQSVVASLITKATVHVTACYSTIFHYFRNLASQVTACVAPNAVAPVQAVAQVDWADFGFLTDEWC